MLREVADGVLVHESEFLRSNAVVVRGEGGVLLVDAGIRSSELAELADDLTGQVVQAGFSTHPHWDHLLWHAGFGAPPRYGTVTGAAMIARRLADPTWPDAVAGMLPEELAGLVPLDDLFGRITGLAAQTIPWDGPELRLIEHSGHAPGHAALLIPSRGVLVAGDMLSDVLIPMLNGMAPDPIGDYLAALDLLEATGAAVVIPGHGSVGTDLQARIDLDRAYLLALRDGGTVDDPRLDRPGWEWVRDIHEGQVHGG